MKLAFNTFLILAIAFSMTTACKNSTGEKAVTSAAKVVKESVGVQHSVDLANSKILWSGSKIASTHTGSINLEGGSLSVESGKVTGGEFVIDLNTLINSDLEPGKGKEKLEGHLKSADFFDVATFPTAKFNITKITKIDGDPAASHLVYGNLTMKDVSKEIGFKASIASGNGTVSVTTPKFSINRTDWGLKYGSSSFFDNLGDKAISNNIDLEIQLTAKT